MFHGNLSFSSETGSPKRAPGYPVLRSHHLVIPNELLQELSS
jgi:hypothetical protein